LLPLSRPANIELIDAFLYHRLALSALSSADPRLVLNSRDINIEDQQIFNVKIGFEGAPITNQRSSGRCWLFASTNVFRVALMKRHNLDQFELSQAYLFFWDKLEKANYFLEQILDTVDEDLDSRLIQTLLASPVSDGGQFDMVFNLVTKYGLCPQVLYPDSFNAKSSGVINTLITTKLKEDALILRAMASKGVSATSIAEIKEKMMREIHLILVLTLGPPPSATEKFTWNYLDKNGKACMINTTPLEFANELNTTYSRRITSTNVSSLFSLVNDPRNEYMKHLTVSRLNNIWGDGARPITYVNVSMDVMKAACIAMLKANQPIFFGSDVGKYSNSTSGIMDLDLIDYELGFNVKLGMDKKERLMTGCSAMTHAMVLTAVHLDEEGKSVRWRVQNSWGTTAGDGGWFVMSDRWMDEFVYQAVVEPRFVSKEVMDVLNSEPLVLPLWDPMGALA
jgi:bleomycin hydrolase